MSHNLQQSKWELQHRFFQTSSDYFFGFENKELEVVFSPKKRLELILEFWFWKVILFTWQKKPFSLFVLDSKKNAKIFFTNQLWWKLIGNSWINFGDYFLFNPKLSIKILEVNITEKIPFWNRLACLLTDHVVIIEIRSKKMLINLLYGRMKKYWSLLLSFGRYRCKFFQKSLITMLWNSCLL